MPNSRRKAPRHSPHQVELESLRATEQRVLVDFLSADLDLAGTCLKITGLKNVISPAQSRSVVRDAKRTLRMVRKFQSRIRDPAELARVNRKANCLEKEITRYLANP